ncbi:hypothetical protein IMY05_005G0001000 [Salix suchowensis]|nr:hypothetical protein IMY05_005G0001000 [Salix suchowensis]
MISSCVLSAKALSTILDGPYKLEYIQDIVFVLMDEVYRTRVIPDAQVREKAWKIVLLVSSTEPGEFENLPCIFHSTIHTIRNRSSVSSAYFGTNRSFPPVHCTDMMISYYIYFG